MKVRFIGMCLVLVLATTTTSQAAAQRVSKAEATAMAMSPAQAALSMKVDGGDQLDPVVWVSSELFLPKKYESDKFFRAMIDKATGAVTYQIYLVSVDRVAKRYSRITYMADGALKSASVSRIGFDVDCGRYGCSYYEDFVAQVPREHLDELACSQPGGIWTARVFGDTVAGTDINFLCNETAGFLLTVDREVAFLGLEGSQGESGK